MRCRCLSFQLCVPPYATQGRSTTTFWRRKWPTTASGEVPSTPKMGQNDLPTSSLEGEWELPSGFLEGWSPQWSPEQGLQQTGGEGNDSQTTQQHAEGMEVGQLSTKFDGQIQTEFLPAEAVNEGSHRPGDTLTTGGRAEVLRALANTSVASESARILRCSPLPDATVEDRDRTNLIGREQIGSTQCLRHFYLRSG